MLLRNISNGFYVELEKLHKQGLTEASFGFLENVEVGEYFNLYDFLHGHCDEFAAALSDYYGYPVEYILDTSKVLVHAYCTQDIDGVKAYIDARGITNDAELFFEEFADFCTYENGRFYDFKGECQVLRHKNTREMYNDDRREPNQDKDLFDFFKDNNLYYDVNLFKEKLFVKTLKDWPEGLTITQYLRVGDKVDDAMYEHFLNIMPPQYHYGGVLQVGGACDAVKNEDGILKNTYLTFVKDAESDFWIFKGECFSREWLNRNLELEPKNMPLSDVTTETLQKFEFSANEYAKALVRKMVGIYDAEISKLGHFEGTEICYSHINSLETAAAWYLFTYDNNVLEVLHEHANVGTKGYDDDSCFGFTFRDVRNFILDKCSLKEASLDDKIKQADAVKANYDDKARLGSFGKER